MTDQVLDIFKLLLLALLYLFFARVLWAVWSEVRAPADARTITDFAPQGQPPVTARAPKPPRGKRGGTPGRLVVLEPKERRGTTFAITGDVGIGRDADNTIVILHDAYISGRHTLISRADGQVVVDDLGSRNGTYLNGTRLMQRHTVHRGDRIQIGYTVLEAQ
ncbi:MAG TPA: FHA domain-containing protein [Ilumatobacter sp.]|nr:FHA domain-containing protein [Ilumatobacter sp.]